MAKVNYQISSPTVRVTQDGNTLGIMSIREAQARANEAELDLVELVPQARPPVCAIMDYGKYRYEQKIKKKEQNAKNKQIATKEIRLRPVSGDHDVDYKIVQAKKFISEKRIVLVNMVFKNRELINKENGRRIINKFIQALEDVAKAESPTHFVGNKMQVRLLPK